MPKIKMIVAMDRNKAIGNNNKLLTSIPEDMARFKKLTTGNIVIMGYTTYKSIGRMLPNRINMILTKSHLDEFQDMDHHCLVVCPDKDDLLKSAEEIAKALNKDIYIIGGESVYSLYEGDVSEILCTEIDDEFSADAYFRINLDNWEEVEREKHDGFDFVTYCR